MWKTASASPPSGGRPPPLLVADHTHKYQIKRYKNTPGLLGTKIARAGTYSFLPISQ